MAEATSKSPKIDAFLSDLTGSDRRDSVRENTCVLCKKPAVEFRDKLSVKEYRISGACQACQDVMFGV